ncbi:MAG: hypothetical protein QF578_02740, partial [Alphaproteobacteria bacterium]|nr:hypothetical protein [Alphaproteobacteria bacterium]
TKHQNQRHRASNSAQVNPGKAKGKKPLKRRRRSISTAAHASLPSNTMTKINTRRNAQTHRLRPVGNKADQPGASELYSEAVSASQRQFSAGLTIFSEPIRRFQAQPGNYVKNTVEGLDSFGRIR